MKWRVTSRRELAARVLLCVSRGLLTAVLTGAQFFGGSAPFAVGAAAAAGPGLPGVGALLGAILGAATLLDFPHALRTVAASILVITANNAFCELRSYRKRWFLPAMTASLFIAVEAVYVLRSGSGTEAAQCLAAAAASALSAHSLRILYSSPEAGRKHPGAALVLLVGTLAALGAVEFSNGFAPGRIAAALAVLLLAFDRSCGDALTAALCVGLAVDLAAGVDTFLHAACYTFTALSASVFRRDSRVRAALAYCGALAFFALPLPVPEGAPLLYEGCAGTLVFLLLPSRALRSLRGTEPPAQELPEEGLRQRLKEASALFRELYDDVARTPPAPEENPAVIFDRTAEKVCRDCSLREYCWEKEYSRTYTALNDATPALLQNARAGGEDFASYFSDRCIRFSSFLEAVNTELHTYLLRRQYRSRLDRSYARAAAPYARLSELLEQAAEQPLPVSRTPSAPPMTYRVAMTLRPKAGEKVSGDCGVWFESPGGELCLLLSDGMGSGEEARKESALTVRLLERFLRSGVDAAPALRTLNSALSLRAELSDSFTTIDFLSLTLKNGESTLYKYGAAPSYVKRGERVFRIGCGCLPAGLAEDGAAPEATHLRLEPGSFFVMATDGVTDGPDDNWLQDMLADWSGDDPKQLAAAILADSFDHAAEADDAGVLVLYLPEDEPPALEV